MKVIGNIIDILTEGKEVCKGTCKECALRIQQSGKLVCMIPPTMECPINDGECYRNKK